MKNSREYRIWDGMKKRCLSKSAINYTNYGGRGITVCDKWLSFEGFFEDMGYSHGLCLDRIDNSKGYSKENCRWVTHKENNRNKANNIKVEGRTLSEWSEISNLSPQVIHYRIYKMNMPAIEAVTKPLMRGRNAIK